MEEQIIEVKEEKPKKDKARQITVVKTVGQSALVEWSDGKRLRRAYVPVVELEGDKCKEKVLDAGIEYGAEWEKYLEKITVSPSDVADALRNSGFWTPDDIECKPKQAQGVLNNILGLNAALLARQAKNDK